MFDIQQIQLPLIKEMYAALTSLQVAFMYGVVMGFSTYLLPQLTESNNDLAPDQWMMQLIGSSSVALRVVGVLIDTVGCDMLGRRKMLQICFVCFIASWIVISCSWNTSMLIIGRLFTGIFTGMVVSGTVYLVEITRDGTRAYYFCMFPTCITIGTESAYILTCLLNWRIVAIIFATYSTALFISACILPESPHWYLMRNNREQAYASIKWFGHLNNEQIHALLNNMENSFEQKSSLNDKLKLIFDTRTVRRLGAVCVSLILSCLTGYLSINNWSVQLFDSVQSVFDSKTLGILFGVVAFVSNICLIILIGRVERKHLIVIAYCGLAITGFALSICQYVSNLYGPSNVLSYLSTFGILVYTVFLYIGAGTPLWIFLTELSPPVIRSAVVGIMSVIVQLLTAIVIYIIPYFIYGNHVLMMCIFSTIVSISTAVITFFLLSNTNKI